MLKVNRIWLPPVDLCCEKATFEFKMDMSLYTHLIITCKTHILKPPHKRYVSSPIKKSRHEVVVKLSENLFRLVYKNMTDKQRACIAPIIKETHKKWT